MYFLLKCVKIFLKWIVNHCLKAPVSINVRKFKRLPDSYLSNYFSSDQEIWVSTGFAYQSKTNDYKVVKLWSTLVVVEVYTLSSDSWRKFEISLRSKYDLLVVVSVSTCFHLLNLLVGLCIGWLNVKGKGIPRSKYDFVI